MLRRKLASTWPKALLKYALYLPALLIVLAIRLMRPWFVIRIGGLISNRIGHFALNTEMYLCERDARINVPSKPFADFFYFAYTPICNAQLATLWKRVLHVWPRWLLAPVDEVNRLIPGGAGHAIGGHSTSANDMHNLLDRFPPHPAFTAGEEAKGEAALRAMGVPAGKPFVCLLVRDSAYLASHQPTLTSDGWKYHDYRDNDVQNYVLAAEALAERGYVVIRMGAKVREAMKTTHPNVIDYAGNGIRSDFMDIYLGAKCAFSFTDGAGWESVPTMFRRPAVYVNLVPVGYLRASRQEFLTITKKHVFADSGTTLTLREIFKQDVGFAVQSDDYSSRGVRLVENTPEEIRDAALEMAERIEGTWRPQEKDEELQRRFWEIFPSKTIIAWNQLPLHGEIRGRFGAAFLRNNPEWLA